MNIHLENVNINSTSGPNHFAGKLIKYLKKKTFFLKMMKSLMLGYVL